MADVSQSDRSGQAPRREFVYTDEQGEVRVEITAKEVSALIEAFNVAEDHGREARPPFGSDGPTARKKLLFLEGGRDWMP